MDLNADFSKRVVVHGARIAWQASPMAGVDRRMLDRMGDETARATSIVRYAPGSHFSAHVHTGGEEFFVLDGVFSDEHGDYPAGTYVRNPPQSRHTPGSKPGCTIFVKLWQFDLADRTPVCLDTGAMDLMPVAGRDGVSVLALFADADEQVSLEQWHAGALIHLDATGGVEVLVLKGGFIEGGEDFALWSWLRMPKNSVLSAVAGPSGARVWIKRGHLAKDPVAPRAVA